MTRTLSLILLSIGWSILPLIGQVQPDDTQQRALELLRQTLADTERQKPAPPQTRRDPALAEKEKQYLAGKIDAKQFQEFLQKHSPPAAQPLPPASPETEARAIQLLRQTLANAGTAAPVQTAPVNPAPSVAAPPSPQPGLSEVEAKMDELLRLKAARDKAAQDKAASPANPAAPKSKRERLDDLLRLHIAGTISEAEYKEKREKIILEKD